MVNFVRSESKIILTFLVFYMIMNQNRKVFIAVMGVTGSGKSTFIKTASQLNVDIGHDLTSCKFS